MEQSNQKLLHAATRLDAALTAQTGPVSMAVRVAHNRLRIALRATLRPSPAQLPEPGVQIPCHICGKAKGQPPERCPGHYDGTSSAPEPGVRTDPATCIKYTVPGPRCPAHRSFNGCEMAEGHAGPHRAGGLTWGPNAF